MRYKLICCEVFLREACYCIAHSPHTVDPDFTPKGAHDFPNYLNEIIQGKINEAEDQDIYDAILLGYGLCGNGTVGLKSKKTTMVIPRAHDCCTIFLGSRSRFLECFEDDLSAEWTSIGYMERGEELTRGTSTDETFGYYVLEYEQLIEKYGRDNAEYLWETFHPDNKSNDIKFIDVPETSVPSYLHNIIEEANKEYKVVRVLEGNIRLIDKLISGNWNEDEFLIIPPNRRIKGVYDHEKVIDVESIESMI